MPAKTLKTIIVTISKEGDTLIEPKGFTGDACLKETRSIEEALGKVEKRDPKPEMNDKIGENVRIGS